MQDNLERKQIKNIDFNIDLAQSFGIYKNNVFKEQLFPFLMAVAKRGQEKNVTFSDEEINAIVAVLKKQATPEEMSKMDKILAMWARKK